MTSDGYFFSTIDNIEDKTGLSEHKQRQALKKLEEIGIVSVKVKGLPPKRYIKLFENNIVKLLEINSEKLQDTISENSEIVPLKIQETIPEKFQRNNNINNNNITIINNGETSSPTDISETSSIEFTEEKTPVIIAPPPPAEKPKRKSLKDQLTEYVNSLDYQQETKAILFKWIFTIGLPRKVRLEQLQDMLKNIWSQCNDESIVREAINEAYLHNWFGFYLPKKESTSTNNYKPQLNSNKADPRTILRDQKF